MYSSKIKMLDEYDKKKKVIICQVHSDEISNLYVHYYYILRRVKELEDTNLEEEALSLKWLFSLIISSIESYKSLLAEYDTSQINRFFTRLGKADPKEETIKVIENIGKQLRSFIDGEVQNKLGVELKYLYYNEPDEDKVVLERFWTKEPKGLKVKRISQYLTEDTFYKTVFYLRSPDYYFDTTTVFKAKLTYYLSYDIYNSSLKKEIIIEENKPDNSAIYEGIEIQENGSISKASNQDFYERLYTDSSHVVNDWLINYNNSCISADLTTSARLFGIAIGEVILYPLSSQVRVIDKNEIKVKKCDSKRIKIDDWLIIKHSSDEEFVKEKAREKLGSSYDEMFEEVIAYKFLLKELLEELGSLERVRSRLKENSIIVERQVLVNWIFGETIRPKEYEKILKLFSYSDFEIKKLYRYSKMIFAAHQYAGRLLGENIQAILEAEGMDSIVMEMSLNQHVEFEAEGMGKFSVETITFVNPDSVQVEYGNLYKTMKTNGKLIKE
ncbi:MAG: hypothetical protein WBA84_08725 [Carnobacterium sp.]|uniref:hypothetical protein n=1 Tax=Carnobacterium sp. TaxID=48221 RepID=UPI003C76BDFB